MKKLLKTLAIILSTLVIIFLTCLIGNAISRDNIEAYIGELERVEYDSQLVPSVDECGNYYFVTDGDFKVMQLTDVHLVGGFIFAENDKRAIHAVAAMIEAEKPDLVIITGDLAYAVPWGGNLDNSVPHGYLISLMERLGVYYTVTFGNHDSEIYNLYNREAVAAMYADETLEFSLFTPSPDGIFGESNHTITVKNSLGLITSSYVMIDSNAYNEKSIFGFFGDYDNVHGDQIEWYRETIEYYTERNKTVYDSLDEAERPADFNTDAILSYIYMHIPPTEVKDALEAAGDVSDSDAYGILAEGISSSKYTDELFETVVELGSTKGVFFGHDHVNSLRLTYQGVTLAYGYSIDYSAYAGGTGYQRGCTLLTVAPDGEWNLEYSSYYSDAYDHLDDGVNMELPEAYQ